MRISDPTLAITVLASLPNGACDATACLAFGEDVTFSATAGEMYFIVVDGADGIEGAHTLDITCPE